MNHFTVQYKTPIDKLPDGTDVEIIKAHLKNVGINGKHISDVISKLDTIPHHRDKVRVIERITDHPLTTSKHVDDFLDTKFAGNNHIGLKALIPAMNSEQLERARNQDYETKETYNDIALHHAVSPETLEKLASDKDEYINQRARTTALENSKCPSHVLDKFVDHPDEDCRYAVVMNPNVSRKQLDAVSATSSEPFIQHAIQRRLIRKRTQFPGDAEWQ
jgi:hypothetical protein